MNHSTPVGDFYSQSDPQNIDIDFDPNLRRLLRAHLLALPYGSFLQAVAHLLECQGKAGVRSTGREGFVGRNRSGGWDLEVNLPAPNELTGGRSQSRTAFASHTSHRARCLVQVKQFDQLAVQQRTVDELRGCCLRAGAGQGLILTTSRFSPVAQAAAAASPLAPITLIDGEGLLTLFLEHKMGVRPGPDGGWRIDPEFFRRLGKAADDKEAGSQPETATGMRAGGRRSSQPDTFQGRSRPPEPCSAEPCSPTTSSPEPQQTRILHLSIAIGPILFDSIVPGTGPGRKRKDRNNGRSDDQNHEDDQNGNGHDHRKKGGR